MTWQSKKGQVRRVIEGKRPVNTKRGHWDGRWGERTRKGSFTMFVGNIKRGYWDGRWDERTRKGSFTVFVGVWEGKGDVVVKKGRVRRVMEGKRPVNTSRGMLGW